MNKLFAMTAPLALLAGTLAAGVATQGHSQSMVGGAASQPNSQSTREVVGLGDARLKFEINATDGDGGVQVFLDADQWQRMSIYDTSGRKIFTTKTKGIMGLQGGTELFMESGEPSFEDLPLDDLLKRWPEGTYRFRGIGVDGDLLVGAAKLTHDLPRGPRLVSPIEGDGPQDPDDTVMRWRGVPAPNGSPIIGYQVLVEHPETGLRTLPTITLDVTMPPSARHLRVPNGFLQPDTEYEWEVLAIERGGNQTLSSSTFTTSG